MNNTTYKSQYNGIEIDQEIKYVKDVARRKIEEFGEAISNKADDKTVVKYTEKNQPNGYVGLNEEGKIDHSLFELTDLNLVQSKVKYLEDNNYHFLDTSTLSWIHGNMSDTSGVVDNQATRIINDWYITARKGSYFKASDGYKLGVHIIKDDFTKEPSDGWLQEYILSKDAIIRISLRRDDNGEMELSEAENLTANIIIGTPIDTSESMLSKSITPIIYWETGHLDTMSSGGVDLNNTITRAIRCRSRHLSFNTKYVRVTPKSNYGYTFKTYENGSCVAPSTWIYNEQTIEVNPNYTYRFVLRPVDDNNTISALNANDYIAIETFNENVEETSSSNIITKSIKTFGDSIWARDGVAYPSTNPPYNTETVGTTCRSYPTLIRERYGHTVLNKAVSGHTILDQLPIIEAEDFSGIDIVIISVGVNDHKLGVKLGDYPTTTGQSFDDTTFIGAYCKAIEHIKKSNPNTKIILVTPMHRDTKWRNNGIADVSLSSIDIFTANVNSDVIKAYRDAIVKIAELYSCVVADMYNESGLTYLTMTTHTSDGLHPINVGYEYTAPCIFNALDKVTGYTQLLADRVLSAANEELENIVRGVGE